MHEYPEGNKNHEIFIPKQNEQIYYDSLKQNCFFIKKKFLILYYNIMILIQINKLMVRIVRFELTQDISYMPLKHARLPFRHIRLK